MYLGMMKNGMTMQMTGFWADEDPVEHEEQEGDSYEFHEDVDEYDVIALNALLNWMLKKILVK